ncbi:MAG TPA: hypothetical protein VKB54_06915 [Solirubrobacteraceae bacterium]|nr:hypothetical protein [Solirubrobacteraceae bacterium]
MSVGGRPPAELTRDQRRRLVRLAAAVAWRRAALEAAEAQLAAGAAAAAAEGASLRAIGEAAGVSKATALKLVRRG